MSDMYPAFYSHKTPKASKPHKCCECFGRINPGEQFHYHSGKWDGEFATFKTCLECEELRGELNAIALPYEEDVPFGCLSEHLFNGREQGLVERFEANRDRRNAMIKLEAK